MARFKEWSRDNLESVAEEMLSAIQRTGGLRVAPTPEATRRPRRCPRASG
jgi:hypothetical protein